MAADPAKGSDRNPKPSTTTSASTCTSAITVFVDVGMDVRVHVDVFFKSNKGAKHTPENVKPPGATPGRAWQSRGISN